MPLLALLRCTVQIEAFISCRTNLPACAAAPHAMRRAHFPPNGPA